MGASYSHKTKRVLEQKYYADFEDDWFEKGVSRLAFQGEWHEGRKNGQKCVVKVFLEEYANKIGRWDAEARTSLQAKQSADAFNRQYRGKEIKFMIPEIVEMKEIACFKVLWVFPIPRDIRNKMGNATTPSTKIVNTGDFVGVEDFLDGNYVKWNANNGFVNPNLDTDIMEAFSHFSYHYSNGQLLVCDLQGVEDTDKYYLTDPAIHSMSGPGYYGPTDLGTFGFQYFFESHKCNQMCQGLRVWHPDRRIHQYLERENIENLKQRGSSYVFQLKFRNIKYGENNSRKLTRLIE